MIGHDRRYVEALSDLLVMIAAKRLSTPLSISWRASTLHSDDALLVQVSERDFARWTEILGDHEAEVTEWGDELHIVAEGVMRVRVRHVDHLCNVRIVTVSTRPPVSTNRGAPA